MGASGGILVIWDEGKIEVLEHEIRALSVSIRCKLRSFNKEWVFVGVYGPLRRKDVDDFFVELDDINGRWNLPWCIGRDVNSVRCPSERKGDG